MKIREARVEDAEEIAKVHVKSWLSTYKGILSDSYLATLSMESRKNSWMWTFQNLNMHERLFVAEDKDGNLVGFSNGGRSRSHEYTHEGELYAIYLLMEYQRIGIGKMLMDAVMDSLREHGYSSMMAWVLKDNPSVAFYRSQGGHLLGEKTIMIGGDPFTEVAIGWERM
jgi:ribosomal protein S18 acetylase RimI-like enzyme